LAGFGGGVKAAALGDRDEGTQRPQIQIMQHGH
jgi:hypothetical protein